MLGAMTKRRRMLGLVAVAAVVGVTAFAGWRKATVPPLHRINWNSVQQTHGDMTLGELEDLFGVPPGDYTTTPEARGAVAWLREDCPAENGKERIEWFSDEICFCVVVRREDGTVLKLAFKGTDPPRVYTPTLLDRVQGWLGW
jgi:hypothetical protein